MKKLIEQYKNISLPVKSIIWFTVCNFLLKGISFISVPLFTKFLTAYEYGKMSMFYSYEQLILIFATFELSLGAYQRGILMYKEKVRLFTNSLIMLSNIITLIVLFIILLFQKFFLSAMEINKITMTLMFVCFLMQPAYNCWLNRKRFYYDYKPAVVATLLFTVFTTGIALVAVIVIEQKAVIKIEAMLIVSIVFYIHFYLKSLNFKELVNNKIIVMEYWKYCLNFQLPLVFHSLSYLMLVQADRIMIGIFVGKSEVAFYSVAYSLANTIIIFQSSINQVFKPWRFQKMENQEYKLIKRTTNEMLVVVVVIILFFILVAPEITKILFHEEYYEAIWVIPPISLSVFFMFLYSIFTDIELYFLKTKYIMYASLICASINTILNYIGIHLFGYIACGYTTLISYILFALFHYLFMRKICIQMEMKEKIFDVKIILVISVCSTVLTILILMLYPYIIMRYIILGVLIAIILTNKNKILIMIKQMNGYKKK